MLIKTKLNRYLQRSDRLKATCGRIFALETRPVLLHWYSYSVPSFGAPTSVQMIQPLTAEARLKHVRPSRTDYNRLNKWGCSLLNHGVLNLGLLRFGCVQRERTC